MKSAINRLRAILSENAADSDETDTLLQTVSAAVEGAVREERERALRDSYEFAWKGVMALRMQGSAGLVPRHEVIAVLNRISDLRTPPAPGEGQ